MTPAPARLGFLFALVLALPAALASAWAWLEHGGWIDVARENERRAIEEAIGAARNEFDGRLRAAAASTWRGAMLRLDAASRIAAEPAPPATPRDVPIGVAEQAAGAHFRAGDRDAALPFFRHAAHAGELSPEGWLHYANATAAAGDPAAACRVLDDARDRHRDARCGPLPFSFLADLRQLEWVQSDRLATEIRLRLVDALATMPAAVVDAAVAATRDAPAHLGGELRVQARHAAAAVLVAGRDEPVTYEPAPGPMRSLLVRVDTDRVAVVPAATIAGAEQQALTAATRAHPSVVLMGSYTPPFGPVDRAPTTVDVFGQRWGAVPATTPTSVLLHRGARAALGLAIATFVLGNLLLWRLTRRELQLVRLRADFVDVVSHELRTPLTALSLKAEMLAAGDVPAARREHYVQALHGDVRRLAAQVERILDFGRLQRGAPLARERVPARTVLARGLRSGRDALRLVQQRVELDAPRALPAIVGDVDVLGRALRNLLENAAKYAPPGSTVAVRAFASGRELTIEVADRGAGVPPHERRAVFQPFVRGSNANGAVPGSGLGLALVAAAAKVHGGRVDVHDRPGGGAVFTLHLPVASRGATTGTAQPRDTEAAS